MHREVLLVVYYMFVYIGAYTKRTVWSGWRIRLIMSMDIVLLL